MVQLKTNTKIKKGSKRKEQRKPKCSLVWHTGLSGVPPDSVRCTRVNQLKLFGFGISRRNSAIIHRTVRCCTGLSGVAPNSVRWRTRLSGAPAEQRLSACNGRLCKMNNAIQNVRAEVRGAPDCPVPQEDRASNGRSAPSPNDRMTWRHWTLSGGAPDCPVRPSPAAYSNCYNLVGGYKYHPNRPLQCVGAQATFQLI
jgi:hypothetical protein